MWVNTDQRVAHAVEKCILYTQRPNAVIQWGTAGLALTVGVI